MTTILVTGAAGKVGGWVVRELAAHGGSVRVLDRRPLPEELRGDGVSIVYADITDPIATLKAAEGCDAILHAAAIPDPHNVTTSDLLRVNVLGTQNILDAARAHAIPRVVLISSIGALGFSFPTHPCLPDYLPVDVGHPRRPQDIYGLSKLMNEESAAAATRLTPGLSTIVLRPPAVIDLEHAKGRGWLGRMAEYGAGRRSNELWAYVDTRDLARACRLALQAPLTGHHVFWTMADDVSADATPRDLVARHLPDLLPFVDNLTGRSFYDLTPTQAHLGFTPEHTWRAVLEQDAADVSAPSAP